MTDPIDDDPTLTRRRGQTAKRTVDAKPGGSAPANPIAALVLGLAAQQIVNARPMLTDAFRQQIAMDQERLQAVRESLSARPEIYAERSRVAAARVDGLLKRRQVADEVAL